MLVATIIAEIVFWVCLILGCVLRYVFNLPKIGLVLLAATPVIDLVLLIFSYFTLQQTGTASFMHGFAMFYIAFSVVFGRDIINAVDRKFSRNTSSAPTPDRRRQFKKCVLACLVTAILLIGGIFVTGLQGSFWLTYWLIAVALMWWGIAKFSAKKDKAEG